MADVRIGRTGVLLERRDDRQVRSSSTRHPSAPLGGRDRTPGRAIVRGFVGATLWERSTRPTSSGPGRGARAGRRHTRRSARAGPKTGGTRWLTHLDATDDAAYAAAVAPIVPLVERSLLRPWSRIGSRRSRGTRRRSGWKDGSRPAGGSAGWSPTSHQDRGRSSSPTYGAATRRSEPRRSGARCSGSDAEPGRSAPSSRRSDVRYPRCGGTPDRAAPSAVLANAVLAEVDERLSAGGYRYVRWWTT